jgi:hypothetical protein
MSLKEEILKGSIKQVNTILTNFCMLIEVIEKDITEGRYKEAIKNCKEQKKVLNNIINFNLQKQREVNNEQ